VFKLEPRSTKHKTDQSKLVKILNYRLSSPGQYLLFYIIGLIAVIPISYVIAKIGLGMGIGATWLL